MFADLTFGRTLVISNVRPLEIIKKQCEHVKDNFGITFTYKTVGEIGVRYKFIADEYSI